MRNKKNMDGTDVRGLSPGPGTFPGCRALSVRLTVNRASKPHHQRIVIILFCSIAADAAKLTAMAQYLTQKTDCVMPTVTSKITMLFMASDRK